MVKIIGPRDHKPKNFINTTTSSKSWSKQLSPMLLGPVPVKMYPHATESRTMENAWQFSKVYAQHTMNNEPTVDYWRWCMHGFKEKWSHRYPMGKGAKPLYSLWDGEKLDYIEARKKIYIPLYKEAVFKTEAFSILKDVYKDRGNIVLWDFDGYNNSGLTWDEIINDPIKKMGHAFVLGMMLEE